MQETLSIDDLPCQGFHLFGFDLLGFNLLPTYFILRALKSLLFGIKKNDGLGIMKEFLFEFTSDSTSETCFSLALEF